RYSRDCHSFPTRRSSDLHKEIPNGAGLGGGSADGAFCLDLLNKKFNLDIPAQKLQDYALTLGSDCPFFLLNKPAIAIGRGEVLRSEEHTSELQSRENLVC